MVEAPSQEQASLHEQRPTDDLTGFAIAVLDAREVEAVTLEDGTRIREISGRYGTPLTETVAPDGTKSFKAIHPEVVISLGEKGMKTIEWKEGSSKLDIEYDMEDTGLHNGKIDDPAKIKVVKTSLSHAFPLPENDGPEGRPNLSGRFGRLSRVQLGRAAIVFAGAEVSSAIVSLVTASPAPIEIANTALVVAGGQTAYNLHNDRNQPRKQIQSRITRWLTKEDPT
jgi:hypothetical protein